jgi:hypothetical protein
MPSPVETGIKMFIVVGNTSLIYSLINQSSCMKHSYKSHQSCWKSVEVLGIKIITIWGFHFWSSVLCTDRHVLLLPISDICLMLVIQKQQNYR